VLVSIHIFVLGMPWKNAKNAKITKNARAVKKQMIPVVGHENLIFLITV
jgi:hypothetical protein